MFAVKLLLKYISETNYFMIILVKKCDLMLLFLNSQAVTKNPLNFDKFKKKLYKLLYIPFRKKKYIVIEHVTFRCTKYY